MIAGLERATSGDVIVAGRRVNDLSPERRNIAMVFQFYALYPALSVRQNIAFPLPAERIDAQEAKRRLDRVANILHLDTVLDRLPAQISEGERQRVAVARAIVREPNCFLFDEPLSRLDVELRQTMRGQIKEVLSGLSKATVIVTHDQLEALTMADRIAIMREGIIEQLGSPHEVFAKPANVFVASFIGTPQMNLIEGDFLRFDAGHAVLAIGGRETRFAVDGAAGRLAPSKVTIGIRPRAFAPTDDAAGDTLTAAAELIEPMGAETLIHVRGQAGQDLRVVVPRDRRVRVGEMLHLRCDPRQTHIFDGGGKAVRT
jgi:multiple sugar transport system ATP-binding protein